MRTGFFALSILLAGVPAQTQGTPPPSLPIHVSQESAYHDLNGTPPEPVLPQPKLQHMKTVIKKEVKKQVDKAIEQCSPALDQWQPLSATQKFHVFLNHTTSPYTFVGAAVNAGADKIANDNMEYARGVTGYWEHYGIELANEQSDALFQSFLIPVLLKQDPRYFRNPSLPFAKRTLYALSRVLITRNDSGHQTFNASYVLGSAASQALSDIYVPGHRQGLRPIGNRLSLNLAIDSGFNLFREFWPDLRRKVLHR